MAKPEQVLKEPDGVLALGSPRKRREGAVPVRGVSPPSRQAPISIGSAQRGISVSLARPHPQPGILPLPLQSVWRLPLVLGIGAGVLPLPLSSGRVNQFAT